MILVVGGLAIMGFYLFSKNENEMKFISSSDDENTLPVYEDTSVSKKILYDIKDIDPMDQKGNYKTDYDLFYELASEKFEVPFALIKAHAIAESSQKPNAYLNENPTARADRIGWASRGLMQILWWPGSERFAKYGYPDSELGFDGIRMFEPEINTMIAAQIIRANLISCKGSIRDAINMYNTGKKESVFKAPNGYTDKVYGYYLKIIGDK